MSLRSAEPFETVIGHDGAQDMSAGETVIDHVTAHGDVVDIADAGWVPGATFDRQGFDLKIEGKDGQQLLIRDYFAQAEPADLSLDGGEGVLRGAIVERLAGPAADGQYAQLDASISTTIGSVEVVDGEAWATRTDGTRVALEEGSNIFMGDVLETASGGGLLIAFVDETTFSLSERARMVIDELVYDPASSVNTASFSLVQGLFVMVSGDVAKTGEMVIETPVSTIGIRGTSVVIEAAAEGEQNQITLLQDPNGNVGVIEVSTGVSSVILDTLGASTSVTAFNQPPSAVEILSSQQIETLYSATLATMRTSGSDSRAVGTGGDGDATTTDGDKGDDREDDSGEAEKDANSPEASEEELSELPPELEEELSELPPELEEELSELPPEFEEELSELPPEFEEEFAELPPELKEEFAEFAAEFEGEFAEFSPEFEEEYFSPGAPEFEGEFAELPPEFEGAFPGFAPEFEGDFSGSAPEIEGDFSGFETSSDYTDFKEDIYSSSIAPDATFKMDFYDVSFAPTLKEDFTPSAPEPAAFSGSLFAGPFAGPVFIGKIFAGPVFDSGGFSFGFGGERRVLDLNLLLDSNAPEFDAPTLEVTIADNDDVFMRSAFAELGVAVNGTIGTTHPAPDNFTATVSGRNGISFFANPDGISSGGTGFSDSFMPGTPIETMTLGFTDSSGTFLDSNRNAGVENSLNLASSSATATNTTATAINTGGITGRMGVEQTVTMGLDDTFYTTTVKLTNNGSGAMTNVRYMRNNDPDPEADSTSVFTTFNDVLLNPSSLGIAAVNAKGAAFGHNILMLADQTAINDDNDLAQDTVKVRASAFGFSNLDPFDAKAFNSPADPGGALADIGINLTFEALSLAAGASITISWVTSINATSIGNDVMAATAGQTQLNGDAGNDRLWATQANTSETLDGGTGDDTLVAFSTGNSNGDILLGGDGDDELVGGDGLDAFTGGSGADIFFINNGNALFSASANGAFSNETNASSVEDITDFKSGTDTLKLLSSVFDNFTAGSLTEGTNFSVIADSYDGTNPGTNQNHAAGLDSFIYSKSNGILFYDTNGVTAGYKAVAEMGQPGAGDIEIVAT